MKIKPIAAFVCLCLLSACTRTSMRSSAQTGIPPHISSPTQVLAVYEPWFGHPQHISVGYSSHDPEVIRKQIDQAKGEGISGFVVDWYGDREPFIDKSYALMQEAAGEKDFKVAMMFDESNLEGDQATDDAVAAFNKFHETYLASNAPGVSAYLTYRDRPVFFIFPKGGHTDWNRVRQELNQWPNPPILIYENQSKKYPADFDGFYAWVEPGRKGWSTDGSNWGEDYLREFYQRMQNQYPNKIVVGAAWPGFDDSKASWSQSRHMSQRCGATFVDTMNLASQYYPASHPMAFLLIATWNDYEEGTAIERGLKPCK